MLFDQVPGEAALLEHVADDVELRIPLFAEGGRQPRHDDHPERHAGFDVEACTRAWIGNGFRQRPRCDTARSDGAEVLFDLLLRLGQANVAR